MYHLHYHRRRRRRRHHIHHHRYDCNKPHQHPHSPSVFQAYVPLIQGHHRRSRATSQVHPADGRCSSRRQQVQVQQLRVGGHWKGRAPHARQVLHPPGLSRVWKPLDEADGVLPQDETHQQQPRSKRTCNVSNFVCVVAAFALFCCCCFLAINDLFLESE